MEISLSSSPLLQSVMGLGKVLTLLVICIKIVVTSGVQQESLTRPWHARLRQESLRWPWHARVAQSEDRSIHVTMMSNQQTGAAAALESVCRNAKEPSRLRFHIIGPEGEEGWMLENLAPSCSDSGAELLLYGIEEMTARVEQAGFSPVWKWPEPPKRRATIINISVRPGEWDKSETHRHPFNLIRFYLPHIQPFKELSSVIFLDDDVLIFGDIAETWDEKLRKDMVMTASCQNWVWSTCNGFESSSQLSYLEVPYLGFGRIGQERSVTDAFCKSKQERECVPEGFFGVLENASIAINGKEHIVTPLSLQATTAWNYGYNKFDLVAWRKLNITEKFVAWSKITFHYSLFPTTSVSFGLGLAMLVKIGHVQCFTEKTQILQGLGFISFQEMKDAKLDPTKAFGIHYNGPNKPWDDRIDNPYANLFIKYAQSSCGEKLERNTFARERARQDREQTKFTSFVVLTDPRSGSEWFMDTLDRHPEICASGEADETSVGFPAESLLPGRFRSASKTLSNLLFLNDSASVLANFSRGDNVSMTCRTAKTRCSWGNIAPVVWHAAQSSICSSSSDLSVTAVTMGINELPVACSLLDIGRRQLANRSITSPTHVQLAQEAFNVHIHALMHTALHAHDRHSGDNGEFLLPCRCGQGAMITGTKVMQHWIGHVHRSFVQDAPWGTNYNSKSNDTDFDRDLPNYDLWGAMQKLQSRVVLYTRRNILARHVSLLVASKNDIYHCTSQECVSSASKIKVEVNVAKFRRFVKDERENHMSNLLQLQQRKIPYIEIFYEDCKLDMKTCLGKVTNFLEVEAPPDYLFQQKTGIYLRNKGALAHKIFNIDEVKAALQEDGENWLHE